MKAIVYRSTGSWYIVKNESGNQFNARLKGVFKIEDSRNTNPLAVGDIVEIEMENESEGSVVINTIYDRKNYINRQSPRGRFQHHVIAANIDQSLMIATLKEPRTSAGFIDRFLVACEMYHVPATIILNKADIYKKKEHEKYNEWKQIYEKIGYPIILTSVKENTGIGEVEGLLTNKITLISGHSGVGKSSLLNILIPALNIKTQDVSGWSGKGLHTTTFAEMFDLPGGGKIIDTPGMREFGLWDIAGEELADLFPEMAEFVGQCKFGLSCQHDREPGCAVRKAVMDSVVSPYRYQSYMRLRAEL